MPVLMKLVSATGTFIFDTARMPLFDRRLEYMRLSDQGYGGRRVNCSLNGFIQGNRHKEVIEKYQALLAIVKANNALFTYQVDDLVIINQQVYFDDYEEPADWKEYEGDYNLTFHYFEVPNHSMAELGITASYSPTSGPLSGGIYTFDPVPLWGGSKKNNREDWRSSIVTPSGQRIADEITVTLTGRLHATNEATLRGKLNTLSSFLDYGGVLNYGSWSSTVRVEDFQIPPTFPRDYCDYSITFKYDTAGVIEFRSRRQYSRLHAFPKITELPYCNTRRIQLFGPSPQTVNYFISVRAMTLAIARSQIASEVANLVISGGIELEGGSEAHDDTRNTVTLNFTKFYSNPVLANLAGT